MPDDKKKIDGDEWIDNAMAHHHHHHGEDKFKINVCIIGSLSST